MFIKIIPNIIILTKLSLGIFSLLETINKNYFLAAIFILLAALVNRYCGKIMRFFHMFSELGIELDSLANLISFGVAPGFFVFAKYNFAGNIGVALVLAYIIGGAYSLAKFNVNNTEGFFIGIPITVAGFMIALFSVVTNCNNISRLLLTILMAVLTYLMVTKNKFRRI